jgi:cytochrome c556
MRRLALLVLPLAAGCSVDINDRDDAAPRMAAPSAAELIAARQAGMHMSATLLSQTIRPAVKAGGDLKPVEAAATSLAHFGRSISGLFPAGSGGAESRARPEIWANKADFDSRAQAFVAASERLAAAAHSADRAAVDTALGAVQQSCGACHSSYRAEESH